MEVQQNSGTCSQNASESAPWHAKFPVIATLRGLMRNLGVGGLDIKDLPASTMDMIGPMTPSIAPNHASKSSKQHSHDKCLNLRLFQAPHQVSHFKTGCHDNPSLLPKAKRKACAHDVRGRGQLGGLMIQKLSHQAMNDPLSQRSPEGRIEPSKNQASACRGNCRLGLGD